MVKVNIHKAKTNLSALVAEVERHGTLVRICRDGKAVAELRPVRKKTNPLKTDPKLKVVFHEDPVQPLEREDWPDDVA